MQTSGLFFKEQKKSKWKVWKYVYNKKSSRLLGASTFVLSIDVKKRERKAHVARTKHEFNTAIIQAK